jgi:hypothetical protein
MAAATELWQQEKKSVFIIAHSNVAVKNIAEKLANCKVDFKLIVSKEFYVEWYEYNIPVSNMPTHVNPKQA